MAITDQLASSLGRRDEQPNLDLAVRIVAEENLGAVEELFTSLTTSGKDVQNDAIKVIYEIAALRPDMVSAGFEVFFKLLRSKNNRLQWGAMTTLAAITGEIPAVVYQRLPELLDAASRGSVITKDNLIRILIILSTRHDYTDTALSILIEQLTVALPNQLPMYAEESCPVITEPFRERFRSTLRSRLPDIEKDSKRKRIEKVINKLGQANFIN